MSRALLLVAHGSPDPDWRRPLERLREQLAATLGEARVGLAYLAHPPHLDEVALDMLAAAGHERILVVAALLSPGGKHVKRDIPAAVDAARDRLRAAGMDVELELAPGALGDDDGVIAALAAAALARL